MPHQYTARILWERADQTFTDNKYSRRHVMRFDGGLDVPGSSSPLVVPLPYSDPQAVDPEEAFVASLSSCHMLWFLDFACRAGLRVKLNGVEGILHRPHHGNTLDKIAMRHLREYLAHARCTPSQYEQSHS